MRQMDSEVTSSSRGALPGGGFPSRAERRRGRRLQLWWAAGSLLVLALLLAATALVLGTHSSLVGGP